MDKEIINNYRDRLRDIILNTCNTIGCDNCGLKWGEIDCSATDLQSKIMNLEMNSMSGARDECSKYGSGA